jgi:hypothetical protein
MDQRRLTPNPSPLTPFTALFPQIDRDPTFAQLVGAR